MNSCKFENGKSCTILTSKTCVGCRFALTHEQAAAKQQKSRERIASLPENIQRYIAEKYRRRGEQWE
jgi:hypothetical protein